VGTSDEPAVRWYALTTKPQHEKRAVKALEIKGFQTFLPLYKSRRQWSDRKKVLELPLFPGYVFCRLTPETRLGAITTPNVTSVVGTGNRPCPVPDEEIEAVRAMAASGLPLEAWRYLEVGQRVRIEGGPLDGLTGILALEKGAARVVVNVSILQRSVAVEIAREQLSPVG
jgi:transcription antitermination factor NusG